MITPWGLANTKEILAEGIVFYSTPGHGGFKVNKDQNSSMPLEYQNKDGWYEEDCEASKVILSFPHLFTTQQIEHAQKSYEYWFKRKEKQ